MHLIEIFLPVTDNRGQPQNTELFAQVRHELVERFGGMTAFTRSPAKGVWQSDDQARQEDEIVIYEVMAQTLDAGWWRDYKAQLEERFAQQQMVIRSYQVELIGA